MKAGNGLTIWEGQNDCRIGYDLLRKKELRALDKRHEIMEVLDVVGHYILGRLSKGHQDKYNRVFYKGCPMSLISTLTLVRLRTGRIRAANPLLFHE